METNAKLTPAQRYFYDVNGYVLLKGIFSPTETSALSSIWQIRWMPMAGAPISTMAIRKLRRLPFSHGVLGIIRIYWKRRCTQSCSRLLRMW